MAAKKIDFLYNAKDNDISVASGTSPTNTVTVHYLDTDDPSHVVRALYRAAEWIAAHGLSGTQ